MVGSSRSKSLTHSPVKEFQGLYKRLNIPISSRIEDKIKEHSKGQAPTKRANAKKVKKVKRNSDAMRKIFLERLSGSEIDQIKEGTADVWPYFYKEDSWHE